MRSDRKGIGGGPRPKVRDDDARLAKRDEKGRNPAFMIRDGERDKVKEWGRVLTGRQIGLILRGPDEPIDASTINRHFAKELEWARANFIADAGGKLYDAVLAGKESSIHFALKVLGEPGQFVERRELTGPGGGPIITADLAALADLDDEKLGKLEQAAALLASIVGDGAGEPAPVSDATGPASGGD